jgi:hypothetical protein
MNDGVTDPAPSPRSPALIAVRYVLPAVVVLAAILVLVLDHSIDGLEGFAMLVGAAGATLLLNILYRVGVSGDVDRDHEAQARDYFDEHGRWPDEEPQSR